MQGRIAIFGDDSQANRKHKFNGLIEIKQGVSNYLNYPIL